MNRYTARQEHTLSPEVAQDRREALKNIRKHYADNESRGKRDRNSLLQIIFPLVDTQSGEEVERILLPAPHVEYFEGDLWLVASEAVNIDSIIRVLSQN